LNAKHLHFTNEMKESDIYLHWGQQLDIIVKLAFIILAINGWLFSGILAGKVSAAQEVPYFSNRDIEKYREPSDNRRSPAKPAGAEAKRDAAAQLREQKEGEYWCRKANSLRKRIENYRDDVQELEKALDELKDRKGKKRRSLETKLLKAKKHLTSSEGDLTALEDEAHRKGIPPGWLRCQFE